MYLAALLAIKETLLWPDRVEKDKRKLEMAQFALHKNFIVHSIVPVHFLVEQLETHPC